MSVLLVTPTQVRAARALLNLTQGDLAEAAGIGIATIKRLELADDVTRITAGVLVKVQTTLEEAGITFIFDDGVCGTGVRLSKTQKARPRGGRARSG